jgi:lysozyme
MGSYAEGIDVSDAGQGVFDWTRWDGHIDFAIVKATEGTEFIDPQFARNWAAITAMDIGRLAYHYGHPALDPSDQAKLFTSTLKAHGDTHAGMCLDIEIDGDDPAQVAFWCWTFCRECDRMTPGKRPMRSVVTYSFPDFIEAGYLAMSGGQPLWLASPGDPDPPVPGPFRQWNILQYAWATNGSGAPNLDRFNGTVPELRKWLGA